MTIALFDFDGTITTHETMPDFIRFSVNRSRLLFGYIFLAPVIAGYKLGFVSSVAVRKAIVRFGYSGVSPESLEFAGREFAKNYLPEALRSEAMSRIAWHKNQGHVVAVVSGGLDAYLAPWCEAHELDLICSSLQQKSGKLTGHYSGNQCVLEEKALLVNEKYDLSIHAEVYAYGDTPEDEALLKLATKRYYQWQQVP